MNSSTVRKQWRVGRFQVEIVKYRHTYAAASPRHVWQLHVVYDEKDRVSS